MFSIVSILDVDFTDFKGTKIVDDLECELSSVKEESADYHFPNTGNTSNHL